MRQSSRGFVGEGRCGLISGSTRKTEEMHRSGQPPVEHDVVGLRGGFGDDWAGWPVVDDTPVFSTKNKRLKYACGGVVPALLAGSHTQLPERLEVVRLSKSRVVGRGVSRWLRSTLHAVREDERAVVILHATQ